MPTSRQGTANIGHTPWLDTTRLRLSSTRLRRGATLTGVIVALQIVIFTGFYSGQVIPPYDFLGTYAGEAFVWWTDGGFFSSPEWIPYVRGGYPAGAGLQNSGWYIPTGITTLFSPYTLHMAAILAALHVAFGAYGMYFLLRAFRAGFGVALFASVAIFFGVGFYSNASHIDIARSYAWLPWILLVLTPMWQWKKWWSIPLATLILWQALTGMYPGMLFAAVYALIPWMTVVILMYRPRFTAFLLPLIVSGIAALLLSMPRILPFLLLDSGDSVTGTGNQSQFTPSIFGTLLFGYGFDYQMPNDLTMRSFFVPATVIVLALFARWRDPLCKVALAIGVPSLLLGMPFFPWFEATQQLPGLGFSRFTMSDFKLFLVVSAILAACSGLRTLLSSTNPIRLNRSSVLSITLGCLLVIVFVLLALRGPQKISDTLPPLLIFCLVLVIASTYVFYQGGCYLHRHPNSQGLKSGFVAVMIALTALSGTVWAYSTPDPWRVPREEIEVGIFGATVDSLISERAENTEATTQRPARTPLPQDFTWEMLTSETGNGAFFSGQYTLGAYVNLKRAPSTKALEDTLLTSEFRNEFAAYLALPGTLLAVDPDGRTSRDALTECTEKGECGITATPTAYEPGRYKYRVSLESATVVDLNEAFFPGWEAEVCTDTNECLPLTPESSPYGTVQLSLPSGNYDLSLHYSTPGKQTGWLLFFLGVLGLVGAAMTAGIVHSRRRVVEDVVQTGPGSV